MLICMFNIERVRRAYFVADTTKNGNVNSPSFPSFNKASGASRFRLPAVASAALKDMMEVDKMSDDGQNSPALATRRQVLHTAGSAGIIGLASPTFAAASTAAQTTRSGDRNKAPLGARLQGVQHFGLTVQNMNRAFEFYTEVLGGTEIMRDGNFQGEKIHNTLLTDQEILARELQVNALAMGVPDLRGGTQSWTCVSYSSTTS
ncbi:VOC family protein [Rhizobium bangladeshense]|uniref:VOC family protein n=2 Tax=Rhizobium bangladeshense TaxID=1138189 RepID=UPI0021B0C62C|nr:VOC family protein [Rhizobium bangladeshense]